MVVHESFPIGEPRVEREADELAANGFDVDVICLRQPRDLAREVTPEGIRIVRMPTQRHRTSGILVQFVEYLTFFCLVFFHLARPSSRYDVVHVHNLPDFLVFAALVPRLRGARIVLDLHDLMPEFFMSRFGARSKRGFVWLLRLQEKLACRFAHHVITVSEPWRKTLIQRSVPANKCSVVMNVAGARFTRDATQLTPTSRGDGFQLLYHGTLAQRYGVDLTLKALAQVRRDLPDVRLTIHGRGDTLDDLRSLAKLLELNGAVTFSTEYVPTADLPRLIVSADVGLVPYRRDVFTDGILPTKLMEYAALGRPAIVARTPAISAYFDESMVEFFTADDVDELADRIRALYRDRARLDELSRNIQRFNQRYSWAQQRVEWINLAWRLAQR
jgi:glycosyltransferase involved in cell wall biosynthesis